MFRHQLRRRDRLDRLAQPHFVADQTASSLRREERPFPLIIVHIYFEKFVQSRAANAVRISRINPPPPLRRISHLRDERQRIVITSQLMPKLRCL